MNDALKSPVRPGAKSPPALVSRDRTLILTVFLFLASLAAAGISYSSIDDLGRATNKDRTIREGIDPNSAQWYELSELPGVGESLARRIVAYRNSQRETTQRSMRPVFESPSDLLPVSGIGPRMLARIAPYLAFPASPRTLVDSAFHNR